MHGDATIDEERVDLRRYIAIFLSRWWLLILLPLVGGTAAYVYSRNQEPVYEATATFLVQQRRSAFTPGISDFSLSEQLAATYRTRLTTSPFLSQVIEKYDLPFTVDQLKSMISAKTGRNPPTVTLLVRHTDPQTAAHVAGVVAEEFIEFVIQERLAEIARLQQAAAAQGLTNTQDLVAAQLSIVDSLALLEPVKPPLSPVLPRTRQNVILGALLGLFVAGALALLLESLGDTVRTPEELNRRFGVTALGTVFRWSPQEVGEYELVVWRSPSSNFSEAFRQVRANFQFATVRAPGKVYLVSSPGPGDGKSTVVSNLAVAFAQAGKRVVVVDGDLRKPYIHYLFRGVGREPGLSNYLADPDVGLDDVVRPTMVEGVHVVTSGPTPPNPAELLGSARMESLLTGLKERYDLVLVDSPPVLMVADAPILASQTDGAVLVVDGFSTRSSALAAALDALRTAQTSVVGVVINKLRRSRFGYGYYHYYYYSYYRYYGYGDSANGRAPLHRRPFHWVRSLLRRDRGNGG